MIQTLSAKINFIWASVQFSCSVVSDSLRPHRREHARPPCANFWSLLKLMSIESVMPPNHLILCLPFSSCLQSLPASRSFQMSWCGSRGCVAWERLQGENPCPRAEKPQQDGRRWSGGCVERRGWRAALRGHPTPEIKGDTPARRQERQNRI